MTGVKLLSKIKIEPVGGRFKMIIIIIIQKEIIHQLWLICFQVIVKTFNFSVMTHVYDKKCEVAFFLLISLIMSLFVEFYKINVLSLK